MEGSVNLSPTRLEKANQLEDGDRGPELEDPSWSSASTGMNSFLTGVSSWPTSCVAVRDSSGRDSEQDPIHAGPQNEEHRQNASRGSMDDAVVIESVAEQDGQRHGAQRVLDGAVTTVMIRNLPGHIRPDDLARALDEAGFLGRYDFLYMPSTLSTGRRHEYAFVNFHTAPVAAEFVHSWHNSQRFGLRGSSRINVSMAVTQGLDANVEKWFVGKTKRVKSVKYWPFIQADRIVNPHYRRLVMQALSDFAAAETEPSQRNAQATSVLREQDDAGDETVSSFCSGPNPSASSCSVAATSGLLSAYSSNVHATAHATSLNPQLMPQEMQREELYQYAPQIRSPENSSAARFLSESAAFPNTGPQPRGCPQPGFPSGPDTVMALVLDANESPAYVGRCHSVDGGNETMQKFFVHIQGAEGSELKQLCMFA